MTSTEYLTIVTIISSTILYIIMFIWGLKLMRKTKRAKLNIMDVFMLTFFCPVVFFLLIWNEENDFYLKSEI